MAERIEVPGDVTGPNAPDQPTYEGYQDESEASTQGQTEQASEEHAFEVPDKFIQEDGTVDVEALSKSYMELERLRSGLPQEDGEMSEESEMSERPEGQLVSADELQEYSDAVLQDGNLSDEAYSDLEARGLPRDLVEAYVEGQKALMNQSRSEFLSVVGGEEAYESLTSWANKNLSDAEIEAYDTAMNSGDHNAIMMNIQGLYARYQQAEGRPNLLAGDTGTIGSSNSFRSWAAVTKAMKDPRYQNDPAYRKDVTNRLAVSDLHQ